MTTALFIFQACYGTPQGYNPGIDEETYQTDTLQTSASEIESADSAATSDMLEAEEITNSKEESE